jgi:4-amino-4-deoxy-L-arabinose transferase-like glycosyltransferase
MRECGWPWIGLLAGLVLLAVGLFFWRLGDRDLWSSHEARAAMDAQSVLEPDSHGVPHLFDGQPEVQKPPLYYWLVAGVAHLRGGIVDGVAVRLPAAVAALLIVALVVGALAWRGRPVAGLLAGLVLGTSIHFPWLARIGRIDVPLALAVTVAVGGFVYALEGRMRWRKRTLSVAWLAVAAGVVLKGPIGLVLPAGVVASWLLFEGRWPALWEWRAWRGLLGELGVGWGLALVAVVSAAVFLWAQHGSGGRFFHEFFWVHNVERGLGGTRWPRSHPWWLYGPYLGLYLLPYSPLLLAAAWPRLWRNDRLARLGLAWLLAVLVVLSAARFKRADYLLPAYPGAAVFLGCVIERGLRERRALRLLAVGVAGLMLVRWGVRIECDLPLEEPYRDYRPFAALVRRHAPTPDQVVFFRTEAHALAFRVGRPLAVVVEWGVLQKQLAQPGRHFVVLPPAVAVNAVRRLPGFRFEELGRTTTLAGGRHERPLVLVRAGAVRQANQSSPHGARRHASTAQVAADRRPAAQRGPAGP